MKTATLFLAGILMLFMQGGCAALLPSSTEVVRGPWGSYQEILQAYDKVVPDQTTVKQLKAGGFNIYSTPNVKILNHIDIAATTQNIKYEDLSAGLVRCIKVRENCKGYQIEPKVMFTRRIGNFWLDLFNFRRVSKGTGWRFKAVFLIIDEVVVDKFWNGDPNIIEDRDAKNPLGPLQEAGSGIINRFVPR